MSARRPSYDELRERLARAEAALDALRRGEVDVVLGTDAPLVVRLKSLVDENERLSREWQTTFNTMQEAVLLLDARQCVLRANRAATRCFDRPPERMAGRPCWEIVHGAAAPIPDCPLRRMRESLRPERGEVRIGERWYDLSVTPVLDADRRLSGAVHVFTDVTDARTARLERERLQASLAQSDRLASMGMLAAGVAHEINNPLSYVLYNLESLAEDLPRLCEEIRRCREELASRLGPAALAKVLGPDPRLVDPRLLDDVVARLREAVEGARRIRQIARSLGAFSRADSADLAPVHLRDAVEHALDMAFHEIKYRARVVKDFQPVPPVLATDGKLVQVFLNLFLNAAHAIPEGHGEENEIRVRTWTEKGRVCAEVSDTGTGIPPELQARVFEPFFTTKGVGAGTGLGLSICRNIVAGLGGEIDFTSEPGRGTRFRVRLPPAPTDWTGPRPAPEEAPPAPPAARGRILVIDDEAGIRATLQRMLGRDHDVVAVASGEEARDLLAKDRRFDLILCDLIMPRLSGMELHAWLAQVDPPLARQVVFITGGPFTPGAQEYVARTSNLRLEKPFDLAGLRRLAGELVLAARSRRDAANQGTPP